MSERVKIAMVGAGRMANNVHYPSLNSFDDVEIAAICDLDDERLEATATKYEVQGRYKDYRKMVEEVDPAGVYVIGQPHYMYDIWIWCLQQGLNLYIEKPMGLTWHRAWHDHPRGLRVLQVSDASDVWGPRSYDG